ncbi:MAG: PEP-CTERM sorting domain-containing protein [Burkholderiales bacterium]|nr:PEP-CTERM sorting domain-containing protein [Burkholderiales bacterium]
MNTRLCGALCAGMISLGVAAHSHAAPVTAVFDSTIDLSGLGGAANAPFKIEYTYDNATPDFDPSGNQGGYEILSGTAQVGSDSLTFGGGAIRIFNNISFPSGALDKYSFSAHSITGSVLGLSLLSVGFELYDIHGGMFFSDALPNDFSFTPRIDTGNRQLRDTSNPSGPFTVNTFSNRESGEFFALDFAGNTTTPLSEPSVIMLMGLGLSGLIGFVRRRDAHV